MSFLLAVLLFPSSTLTISPSLSPSLSAGTVEAFAQSFFTQATSGLSLTALSHPNANVDGAKGKGRFIYERDAW